MALTRDFKETIRALALKDSAFRISLLEEYVNEFLAGDLDTAKALLRDYVNASVSWLKKPISTIKVCKEC
jgi:hypothetical protein